MALQFARKAASSLKNIKPFYLLQFLPLSLACIWWIRNIRGYKDIKIFLITGLVLTMLVIIKSNEFNYPVYTIPYVLGSLAMVLEEKKSRLFQLFIPMAHLLLFCGYPLW